MSAELRFPPEKFKDWDEWFLAEPEQALATTKGWIDEQHQATG